MKNLLKVTPLAVFMMLASCTKDQSADQLVTEESTVVQDQSAQDAVVAEMPEAAEAQAPAGPLTTVALSEAQFDFGKIKKGEQKEHIYEITNTGDQPLIISNVEPTCGCTVPEYTKEPVMPGKKAKITLNFDSSSFEGLVNKQAKVFANVERNPIMLSFTADIQP